MDLVRHLGPPALICTVMQGIKLHYIALCCTLMPFIALCCTVLLYIALCCTILPSPLFHSTALKTPPDCHQTQFLSWDTSKMHCSAVQWSAVQYNAVQCSIMQCSAVQYSEVQHSTVQYNGMNYRVLGSSFSTSIRTIEFLSVLNLFLLSMWWQKK